MWAVQQAIRHPLGVTVYGSSLMRTEPDVADATIAIRRVAKNPAEAFKATRDAVQSVREALTRAGIESDAVEVSRVALEDAFEYVSGVQKRLGYLSNVTFRIRIHDVELVERVLIDAVAGGANHVQGVTYNASMLRELREDVRRHAVAAARRKAEVYCEAAECQLGPAIHIEDVDPDKATQPTGHMREPAPALETSDAGTLGSGSLTIAAAVMIVYSLLPS